MLFRSDRCNVRGLSSSDVGGAVDLVVADLSFISLTLVLPALAEVVSPSGDMVVMVKPQFEVGAARVGANGVVTDRSARAWAVTHVASAAKALGWPAGDLVASPLPGPAGNHEFFLWLRRDAAALPADMIAQIVEGDAS